MNAAKTTWLSTNALMNGAAAVTMRGSQQYRWCCDSQQTEGEGSDTAGRFQPENAAAAEEPTRKHRRYFPTGMMGEDSTTVVATEVSC